MRFFRLLTEANQAHRSILALWAEIKPYLMAGQKYELIARPATRTTEQNSKFHALCSALARSNVEWAGKRRSDKQWKVLLVSGHAKATGEEFDMVPGLEGEFINLRESTALMSVRRGSSLIEYSVAFCAMNEVATELEQSAA